MQQLIVAALYVKTGEVAAAKNRALPQALQILRQQFLILATPLQADVPPAFAQTDDAQPQAAWRVLRSQGCQRCNKACVALVAKDGLK